MTSVNYIFLFSRSTAPAVEPLSEYKQQNQNPIVYSVAMATELEKYAPKGISSLWSEHNMTDNHSNAKEYTTLNKKV